MPTMSMRVIPVLDLKGGLAVHAIAGDRAHYRPVRSVLHEGPDPIGLARAYRDVLGLRDLYLADLDAIEGAPPALALYHALLAVGLTIWADAGLVDGALVPSLLAAGVSRIIAGLETVHGPAELASILDLAGRDRVVFSLDLRAGMTHVAEGSDWRTSDPLALAEIALDLGVRRLLLLDLARVGTGQGTGTMSLLEPLAADHPEVEIGVGGGVAGPQDMLSLARSGARMLLIGSAIHDGRIGAEELSSLRPCPQTLGHAIADAVRRRKSDTGEEI